jgi:hypothetical protein
MLTTDLVGAALVLAAIRLDDGAVARRGVVQALVTGAVAAVTTTSVALNPPRWLPMRSHRWSAAEADMEHWRPSHQESPRCRG